MNNQGDVHKVASIRASLGESPVWDERNGLLYFIDISGGEIKVLRPQARVETLYQSAARIGALSLTDTGNLIFTENTSTGMLNVKTKEVYWRTPAICEGASYRFNDGACDPQGRFVTGLMDEGPNRRAGALYRYDSELNARIILQGVALPNGLAWSEDGGTLFFVDSIARSIFRTTYSAEGELGAVMLFARTPAELGRPDGIALDRAGGLWVCQFNGGCLLRYDSEGQLSNHLLMPVPRPTSCCFGGANLDTLFITTARFAMTPSELADFPDAGDLYVFRPDVAGIPRYLYRECFTEGA
ncbi:SMP-30/gluconolactonase/LRE family protein [Klebsiella sp. BIGb0407]|uniref:SMP-30/gluconolactonase/LRE family protein n=1 Tax=Klebsiella sp. BIGb0407 TaxID=2940603 RepID=UPI00216A6043|nr:SMP-30/gluconolactonase/LRE family protein [Klebsiella sp. BIGb0407]MCS3430188.1 sugar lactone lactonase YvrE [Klebsiella sp. BIGb0407]